MSIVKLYPEREVKLLSSSKKYLMIMLFLFGLAVLSVFLFYFIYMQQKELIGVYEGKNYSYLISSQLSKGPDDSIAHKNFRMESFNNDKYQNIKYRTNDILSEFESNLNIQILIIMLMISSISLMLLAERRRVVKIFNKKCNEKTKDLNISNKEVDRVMEEMNNLKECLIVSDKKAAVGALVSGVVHDFNNSLHVVLWNLESAIINNRKQNSSTDKNLINIEIATEYSKGLIDNLMAYCRGDMIKVEAVNASSLLQEIMLLLSKGFQKSIKTQAIIDDSLPEISFNRVGMQQIVANLYINACDAVGDNGRLSVYLKNKEIDFIECTSCGKKISGKYVTLVIEDDGHGINSDDMKNIFKPLFTTKRVGKGTGLGLYVVNEIIHKYGGHINVDSVEGAGTKFSVYFPIANQ
ncbi:MAG: HAMP domain-containing histidine kinase, partial [Gammaproteobacteria bacterium]|nr:HAMP domain-containing histidine kinase [Gammaproteobacteria bacterium]